MPGTKGSSPSANFNISRPATAPLAYRSVKRIAGGVLGISVIIALIIVVWAWAILWEAAYS